MNQFVNSAAFADTTTTGTSLACPYTVNPGDLIVASIAAYANLSGAEATSLIDDGGNVYTRRIIVTGRNPGSWIYTTLATNHASLITATYPAGVAHAAIIATYRGTASIGSNSGTAISPTNTTPASLPVALASPVNWAVGALNSFGATTTVTTITSGNLRNSVSSTANLKTNLLDITGGTSLTLSATFSANTNWTMGYIELVPSVPSLSGISPNTGTQGNTVPVTLTGTNLTGATAINVTGTGISVTNLTVVNDTTVTASLVLASSASVGAQTLTVTTPTGTSNAVSFTVQSASTAPTLGSISPSSGVQGTTVPVTLTGTHLTGATAVNVTGGVSVTNLVVVNDTTITANLVLAAGSTVSVRSVTVTTPSGTSNPVSFEVQNAVAPGVNLVPVAATLTLINN